MTVYGMVRDSQVTDIVITWDDGYVEIVEVQKSAYFTAREGNFNLTKVKAFNDQNGLVYTTERQE
jgi:flagellar hook protein FlgE